MQEQFYLQSTYTSIHHAQTNIMEELTNVFDRVNEKIQSFYAYAIDALADRVIRRFDL